MTLRKAEAVNEGKSRIKEALGSGEAEGAAGAVREADVLSDAAFREAETSSGEGELEGEALTLSAPLLCVAAID